MRRGLLLWLALVAPIAFAMPAAATQPSEVMQWRSGLSEINEGWATHEGDDPAWANPQFDDRGWQPVDLDNLGAARPGLRWYRLHVRVGPEHPNVQLLLEGGDGVYELYVNGVLMPEARLRPSVAVSRPTERVFSLSDDQGDFVLALRTHAPVHYAAWHLPLFLSVTLGMRTAIEYEHEALASERLLPVVPSLAINLLLVLAGLGSLALFTTQRHSRDYFFLGCYLLLIGVANGLLVCQLAGILPTAANFLLADPLSYLFTITQIEFTFSFTSRRVTRPWRAYELLILLMSVLVVLTWTGHLSTDRYVLVEAVLGLPAALLLPVMLFVWYRHGNREAGWLIFPSMLPIATNVLIDIGTASIYLGWKRLDFLDNPIPLGPIPLETVDLGSLLFLLAIAFVMFFRFTRVSRDQARSAAELNAAREIQQRLVPAALPNVPGYVIEAAYMPAQEVGGDFYQVLPQPDGATLIVIGDVSGKGLKAAMTGALAIGALRTLSSEGLGPAALLTRLNQQLLQTQDAGFVTCLCARIDADGGMNLCNAGHLAPYRNGVEVSIESGLPLGITADAAYAESFLRFELNDTLTLLSDGVLEARNAAGELFGFDRTLAVSTESAEKVAQAAKSFGQEDDITVLTLRFVPVATPPVP
jgi:sigma-B regulation protein RsbU (phosphoserine phosphatase)